MKTWYHVLSYPSYPPTIYGFAINEEGICVTAHEKVSGWIVGKHIDFIKQFYSNKPAEITEVKTYENGGSNQNVEVQSSENESK